MANLPENPIWESGVYQLETTDPVLGGVNGVSNAQAKALANRTQYLKEQVEAAGDDLAAHVVAVDPHPIYMTAQEADAAIAAAIASKAPLASPALTGTPTAPTPSGGANNAQLATTAFVQAAIAAVANTVPSGAVAYFGITSAPAGWLKANGAAISRTTYAALFAAIGTTFGAGDGSTTFALPDLRGEFIRCADDGRGIDPGRLVGGFQGDDIKSHTHTVPGSPSGSGYTGALASTTNGLWTSSATGGAETRPRNIALLACIKY